MQSILRITLLMTCLASGIAVAVAVAMRTPPQKSAAAASAPEVNPVSTHSALESQSLPLPLQAAYPNYRPIPYEPIFEPIQPAIAPYQAAVAQQVDPPQPALEQP